MLMLTKFPYCGEKRVHQGWLGSTPVSDCMPTPPLTQQKSPDNKLEIKMG